jgi:hypothetical protein
MSSSENIFAVERFEDIVEELKPLLALHYHEIAHYKDIELKPDFESYQKLQDIGAIVCFTARRDGQLIGYNLFFVRHNLHYMNSKQAVQDVVFIHPEFRGFGKNFFIYCDNVLKSQNVQVVYHHIKAAHNFGSMLESIGYKLVDLIYAKRLD